MTDNPPLTTETASTSHEAAEPDVDRQTASPRRAAGATAVGILALVLIAALVFRNRVPSTSHYVGLSMFLFVIGALGVLLRRNALVLFMCIELMLNAVNIAFVAFSRLHGSVEGHSIVLFVIIVAAAEVAVGLAIIVSIFRRRRSINVDDLSSLRW